MHPRFSSTSAVEGSVPPNLGGIDANDDEDGGGGDRDHSEWSTLRLGPLHRGLELEVDPTTEDEARRRRQQNRQRGAGVRGRDGAASNATRATPPRPAPSLDDDVDLIRLSPQRNQTHRGQQQQQQARQRQRHQQAVELSPCSSFDRTGDRTVSAAGGGKFHAGDDYWNGGTSVEQPSGQRRDLRSFRRKTFGTNGATIGWTGNTSNRCGDGEEEDYGLLPIVIDPEGSRGTSPLTAPMSTASSAASTSSFWGGGGGTAARPLASGLTPPSSRVASPALAEEHPCWTDNANGNGNRAQQRYRPRTASSSSSSSKQSSWSSGLNVSLFAANLFSAAAETVPITLVPTIGATLAGADASSSFASRAAASAVLGTACGKFVNGPAGDIFGARRVACLYALLLSASLLILSWCTSESGAIAACAMVEFFASVQQPCVLVVLAAHCRDDDDGSSGSEPSSSSGSGAGRDVDLDGTGIWDDVEQHGGSTLRRGKAEGRYETGIYVASLGARCGSLLAIPLSALLLKYTSWGWRVVARCGALAAFVGFTVLYGFVTDSPGKVHDPQNPIRSSTIAAAKSYRPGGRWSHLLYSYPWVDRARQICTIGWCVFVANVFPSVKSVLTSGTFWIVAVAHAGGSMVRSSERILGTYLRDTSGGTMSEKMAGGLTVFLSLGLLFGLAVGGSMFTRTAHQPWQRKAMVVRLYVLAITMCYTLSFLAAPFVRSLLWSSTLVTILQIVAAFVMGAGVAVQYYQIPAIVGATFGANKGLYSAYTDGVAYGVSSIIWRIVGGAVEEGNPEGGGWAYGWAAVALLVVLCGVLMVEFMEHYFCRGGWKGRMRRAASDAALRKKADADDGANEAGIPSSGMRRRFGVGSLFCRQGMHTPEKALPTDTPISSPIDFFKSIGSLRKKGALDEHDYDNNDDEEDMSTILFDTLSGPIEFDDDALCGPSPKERARSEQVKQSKPRTKAEELNDRVLKLLDSKENQVCSDCPNRLPRWASIIVPSKDGHSSSSPIHSPLGCFCCHECVGSHRKLGTHIIFVRSVDHDIFTEREVKALENGGNMNVNILYEATLTDDALKPGSSSKSLTREKFITAKYEKRLWSKREVSSITFEGKGNNYGGAGLSSDEEEESDGEEEETDSAIELVRSYDGQQRTRQEMAYGDVARGEGQSMPYSRESLRDITLPGKISIPASSTFDHSFSPLASPRDQLPSGSDLINLNTLPHDSGATTTRKPSRFPSDDLILL